MGKREKVVIFGDIVSVKYLWVGKEMADPPPPCLLTPTLSSPTARLNAGRVGQILCSISGIVQAFQGKAITCLLIYRSFPYSSTYPYSALFSCKTLAGWLPLTVLYVWLLLSLMERCPCERIVKLVIQQVVGFAQMAFVDQNPHVVMHLVAADPCCVWCVGSSRKRFGLLQYLLNTEGSPVLAQVHQ